MKATSWTPQARLYQSEDHCRLALEAAKMGTWEWNAQAGTIEADAFHQLLFGLPPQQGPRPLEVYFARMLPDEMDRDEAQLALLHGADYQSEKRVIRPNGEVIWILSRGRVKPGDPNRMVGVTFDITERKRAEQQLRDRGAQLKAAADLIGLGSYTGNGTADILTKAFPGHDLLTPRERMALAQIVRGDSSKEAARTLGVSPRTMEFHRANILKKLGARNTVDLVRRVLAE